MDGVTMDATHLCGKCEGKCAASYRTTPGANEDARMVREFAGWFCPSCGHFAPVTTAEEPRNEGG